MGEEVGAFAWVELSQGLGSGGLEGRDCPRGGLSDMRFELGEGGFDWIEVGTVRGKVEQPGAARLDGLLDAVDLVGRQIVHDDDVARPQGRRQHLLDPGQEALSVHRSVKQHRRDEAAERERSEEHTSELQSLMRISYAVFCLKKKNNNTQMN